MDGIKAGLAILILVTISSCSEIAGRLDRLAAAVERLSPPLKAD